MTRRDAEGLPCTVHGGTRWLGGYCERWSRGSPQRSGEEWRALGPCLLPETPSAAGSATTTRALHGRMLRRIAAKETTR